MESIEKIELLDCPLCGGPGLLEEECGSGFCVTCMDCGSQTVIIDFKSEGEKFGAAQKAADLWNTGKVISSSPGE